MSDVMDALIKLSWSDEKGPRTGSLGQCWHPEITITHANLGAIRDRVVEATRSNHDLLESADQNPPPQSWWDEQIDPFTPEDTED